MDSVPFPEILADLPIDNWYDPYMMQEVYRLRGTNFEIRVDDFFIAHFVNERDYQRSLTENILNEMRQRGIKRLSDRLSSDGDPA